jgi:hypothetical protein
MLTSSDDIGNYQGKTLSKPSIHGPANDIQYRGHNRPDIRYLITLNDEVVTKERDDVGLVPDINHDSSSTT